MGERNTISREGRRFSYPMAAGVTISAGNVVVMQAGAAKEGLVATGLVAVGIAEATVVNSGAAGASMIDAVAGTYRLDNDAVDPVGLTDIGSDCYLTGPASVAKTNGTGTRSRAGRVCAVDADGVWVTI